MVLFVVGNLEPEQLMDPNSPQSSCQRISTRSKIERFFPENQADVLPINTLEAAITREKFVLGIKGIDVLPENGRELLRYKTAIRLLPNYF